MYASLLALFTWKMWSRRRHLRVAFFFPRRRRLIARVRIRDQSLLSTNLRCDSVRCLMTFRLSCSLATNCNCGDGDSSEILRFFDNENQFRSNEGERLCNLKRGLWKVIVKKPENLAAFSMWSSKHVIWKTLFLLRRLTRLKAKSKESTESQRVSREIGCYQRRHRVVVVSWKLPSKTPSNRQRDEDSECCVAARTLILCSHWLFIAFSSRVLTLECFNNF